MFVKVWQEECDRLCVNFWDRYCCLGGYHGVIRVKEGDPQGRQGYTLLGRWLSVIQ